MTSMATVGIDGQRKKCVGILVILQALFVCIVRLGHVVVHAHKLEVVACASIVKQCVSHVHYFFSYSHSGIMHRCTQGSKAPFVYARVLA